MGYPNPHLIWVALIVLSDEMIPKQCKLLRNTNLNPYMNV